MGNQLFIDDVKFPAGSILQVQYFLLLKRSADFDSAFRPAMLPPLVIR